MVFFRISAHDPGAQARDLGAGAKAGQQVVYFPRRSFDIWNSRYFILPVYPRDWMDEDRGYAAFLENTELVYPCSSRSGRKDEQRDWIESHDYQIRRNRWSIPAPGWFTTLGPCRFWRE